MKQCSKCKLEKNTSEFYSDKRNKSGLYCACKDCHNSYHYPFKVIKEGYKIKYMQGWRLRYLKPPALIVE